MQQADGSLPQADVRPAVRSKRGMRSRLAGSYRRHRIELLSEGSGKYAAADSLPVGEIRQIERESVMQGHKSNILYK